MAPALLRVNRMQHGATLVHHVDHTRQRVIGEYLEMPGLSLTVPQARRLLGLDTRTCERVLEELVREHFLRRTPHGVYVRTSHA